MEEHWAEEYLESIREAGNEDWMLNRNQTSGPVEMVYKDGTQVVLISSPTTNYVVDYEPSDEVSKEAVTDTHVTFGKNELHNAVEWMEHVISRHEKLNG